MQHAGTGHLDAKSRGTDATRLASPSVEGGPSLTQEALAVTAYCLHVERKRPFSAAISTILDAHLAHTNDAPKVQVDVRPHLQIAVEKYLTSRICADPALRQACNGAAHSIARRPPEIRGKDPSAYRGRNQAERSDGDTESRHQPEKPETCTRHAPPERPRELANRQIRLLGQLGSIGRRRSLHAQATEHMYEKPPTSDGVISPPRRVQEEAFRTRDKLPRLPSLTTNPTERADTR